MYYCLFVGQKATNQCVTSVWQLPLKSYHTRPQYKDHWNNNGTGNQDNTIVKFICLEYVQISWKSHINKQVKYDYWKALGSVLIW